MKLMTKNDCSQKCVNENNCCSEKTCENYIEFNKDLNCIDIALAKNDYKEMPYRDVAERLGITAMGALFIERRAKDKLKKIEELSIY